MAAPFRCLATLVLSLVLTAPVGAAEERADGYVFGWPFLDSEQMKPRGGSTRGPSVELRAEPTEAFQRLQAPELSKRERDRRAILALAGSYRVTFDFLEVMGFAPDFEPAQPYQSWGTEHIYVVTNTDERIVLQHVLVMTIIDDEGNEKGPFVTKHWRQDWQWQAEAAHTFRGLGRWARETRDESERRGRWLQQVWQVDDSPRYAAWGRWRHTPERSTWVSGRTWRPLPRREFSVRDDYDALIGTNRISVLPTGWVQEQNNVKTVLAAPGEIERRLAKEIGIARYERITDLDKAAADRYWTATRDYWALVRAYWRRAMADNDVIELRSKVDDKKLFEPLFARARKIADGESFGEAANRRFIRETIARFRGKAGDSKY